MRAGNVRRFTSPEAPFSTRGCAPLLETVPAKACSRWLWKEAARSGRKVETIVTEPIRAWR